MRPLTLFSTALVLTIASQAFAAGSSSDTPPKSTRTTTECTDGKIYDDRAKACVDADRQSFNDDARYDAVRELAYAGAYDRAERVIAAADNPEDPRFLNYRGFISRKIGNTKDAMVFYSQAIEKAPDYHLARSYLGQGLVKMGDIDGAKAQLAEIAARGGEDTWAYTALAETIEGKSYDY